LNKNGSQDGDTEQDPDFEFDYFANIKKREGEDKARQSFNGSQNEVTAWIDGISSNGNITIRFNANLTVPENIKNYLEKKNYNRRLQPEEASLGFSLESIL